MTGVRRYPAMPKTYYVYIMSNQSKMLYVGVTHNLQYRVAQHKKKLVAGYTKRYNLFKLVYYETFSDVRKAIAREKELKGWLRAKKVALITRRNPAWNDLAAAWFTKPRQSIRPTKTTDSGRTRL
jgi:putative endonuclease